MLPLCGTGVVTCSLFTQFRKLKPLKAHDNKHEKKEPVRVAQGIEQLGGLLTEQCRLYRSARRGEVSAGDGYKLMRMLSEIRTTISTNEVEDRLAEAESLIKELAEKVQ